MMSDLKLVTYCGLYCGLCGQCSRIPQRAAALRDSMQTEGWHLWGNNIPQFKEFWTFLNGIVKNQGAQSCRENTCGYPPCGIRKCARQRDVVSCPFCEDYPCHRIEGLAKGYVNMLADGRRMKTIGIEKWIVEQQERVKTGFAYCDIRCQPYEVPGQ